MPSTPATLLQLIRHSNVVRILMLFVLVILFQVPIFAIDGMIRERQQRRDAAVEEVASKWGRQQSITGPMLVVPYLTRSTDDVGGKPVVREQQHVATFLPEQLSARGKLAAEARRRGIFSTSVYHATLHVEGSFVRPSFTAWGVAPSDVQWDRARIVMGVSDVRAIESTTSMRWNGVPIEVLPGTADGAVVTSGVHGLVAMPEGTEAIPFTAELALKGSSGAYWAPLGKTTELKLESNWTHPSFQGSSLPEHRAVSNKGFEADWAVAYLGRNVPQSWTDSSVSQQALEGTRFGVDLIAATDHYQMATRSVKYAGMFLLLTFATLWLVEVLARVSIHPIQLLLIGSALCVFYLLELSLSEHLGFGLAYLVATLAIVMLVTAYSAAVLATRRRAAIVGSVVAALYGYLYIVLTNEDYALLIGSIGVFAILGAIMYLTRRVDWYGTNTETASA